jgi:TonB family protein
LLPGSEKKFRDFLRPNASMLDMEEQAREGAETAEELATRIGSYGPAWRPGKGFLASLVLHVAFLGWLLHRPAPIFVAPSSTLAGISGASVTHLYWPSDSISGASGAPAKKRVPLVWKKAQNATAEKASPESVTAQEAANQPAPDLATSGASAGSPYGSLSEGPAGGHEIRAALPMVTREPLVDRSELAPDTDGNVVVEITIDEAGNIVGKVVIASLGAEVDAKVLAALDNWKFRPATRDGVPIPSKQDVVYHFKSR